MKKDSDEIIVNLNGDDNAEVRKLTDSEQLQMKKLQKELRKELGLDQEPLSNNINNDNISQSDNIDKEDESKPVLQTETVNLLNNDNEIKQDSKLNKSVDNNDNKTLDANISENSVDNVSDNQPLNIQESIEVTESADNEELTEENTREEYTDNYEQFFKQYSRKEDEDSSSFGKYDSDLDFKLNRRLKKVRLPLQKKYKALMAIMSVVVLVCACIGLGLGLYKKPQPVLLTSISITQPKINDAFVVEGKFVNDYINYDNIYLICNYSNGKTKKVLITKDMVTSLQGPINSSGKFISSGEVIANIIYQGKELKLKYIVSEKIVDSISIISTNFTISSTTVDLTNKLKVVVNYKNATSEIIDINDCKFMVDLNTIELHPTNGVINVGSKATGRHTLRVIYKNVFSDISVYIDQR